MWTSCCRNSHCCIWPVWQAAIHFVPLFLNGTTMKWTYATWDRSLHLQSLWLLRTSATALDPCTIISGWHNQEVNLCNKGWLSVSTKSPVAFNLTCVISSHPFHTIISKQHNHYKFLSNTGQVTVSPASPTAINYHYYTWPLWQVVIHTGTLFPHQNVAYKTHWKKYAGTIPT